MMKLDISDRFCIEVGFPAYLVAGVSPATVASTPFAKCDHLNPQNFCQKGKNYDQLRV